MTAPRDTLPRTLFFENADPRDALHAVLAPLNPCGRTARRPYALWMTGSMVTVAFLSAAMGPVATLPSILIIWSMVSALIRRLHDFGASGWWAASPVFALAALFASIVGVWMTAIFVPTLHETVGDLYDFGMPAIGLWTLGMLCVSAVVPGAAAANRFGAPPGGRLIPPLKD